MTREEDFATSAERFRVNLEYRNGLLERVQITSRDRKLFGAYAIGRPIYVTEKENPIDVKNWLLYATAMAMATGSDEVFVSPSLDSHYKYIKVSDIASSSPGWTYSNRKELSERGISITRDLIYLGDFRE